MAGCIQFTVLIAIAVTACAHGPEGAADTQIARDVAVPSSEIVVAPRTFTYKTVGSLSLRADVYRLQGTDVRPVIVWIHPGALILGSRDMLPTDQRDQFLRAGFVVVAIDYRLAPETKLPEILNDVVDALRWLRENGPQVFQIDSQRVALVGQSAGAYLALLAAATIQPRVQAVVSFYGYGDISSDWITQPDTFYLAQPRLTREDAHRAVGAEPIAESPPFPRNNFYTYCRQNGVWLQEVVGLDAQTQLEKLLPYTPERLITFGYPPTLLLHGDQDIDVPFHMSERLAGVLTRHQVQHQLYRMNGFNHMFDVFPEGFPPQGPPTGMTHPKVAEALQIVMSFLARHVHSE
jgi:acetyl esterase/lipase